MEKILAELYYNPSLPSSFSDINRMHFYAKKHGIRRKETEKFLMQQPTYTMHRSVKHTFKRRKVVSPGINYHLQSDLIVLDKLAPYNSGYRYIMTIIDVFSRKAIALPLKRKSGECVANALDKILTNMNVNQLECDDGKEYFNKSVTDVLKKHRVKLYSTYSDKGASLVERFNRTLMNLIQKHMTANNTKRYVDKLEDIVNGYNNKIHRIIKCTPNSVNKFNEMDVWLRSYADLYSKPVKKAKLSVGDLVRIKVVKNVFSKGYTCNYTKDVYKIKSVNRTIPVTYTLEDSNCFKINGSFYEPELSLIHKAV